MGKRKIRNKAYNHEDLIQNPNLGTKVLRNEFIDIDTGKDIYDELLGKRISVQRIITKLRKYQGDNDNFGISRKNLNDEVHMTWDFEGLWYAEGLTYMLPLGKDFKAYLMDKGYKRDKMNFRNHIYEFIPTDDMNIFELDMYQNRKDKNLTVSFKECLKYFDGINLGNESKPDYAKYLGCFWKLKPGFKVKLLYSMFKFERIDKENDIWRFYLKKNLDSNFDLTY